MRYHIEMAHKSCFIIKIEGGYKYNNCILYRTVIDPINLKAFNLKESLTFIGVMRISKYDVYKTQSYVKHIYSMPFTIVNQKS